MTYLSKVTKTKTDDAKSIPETMGNSETSSYQTLRWGVSIPLAGLMTLGLAVTMAGLIAVEFIPQDKTSVINANINPVVEDIVTITNIKPPKRQDSIEVPPPPPSIGHSVTDKVVVSPIETKVVKVDIDLSKLRLPSDARILIDAGHQPLLRVPPVMPKTAQRSGHCKVRFDVSPQGHPFNVETTYCSEKLFSRNTVKSVGRWKFRPKTQGGQAVTVHGVENTVRFELLDERGRVIAE